MQKFEGSALIFVTICEFFIKYMFPKLERECLHTCIKNMKYTPIPFDFIGRSVQLQIKFSEHENSTERFYFKVNLIVSIC